MKLIAEGTKKLANEPGYEASLPWRGGLRPKNDPEAARKRYSSIKKKMERVPEFAEDYRTAIGEYIKNGYAKSVTETHEINHPNQRWLPHHGVYKNPKTRKLRVVFDSAALYHGVSLNDCLYTGPALQNDLINLLIGFREFDIALTSDIEAMYSRIKMNPEDARYHRFLWETEPGGEVGLFEMTGVVFGDSPSPCQAKHVLHRTAEEFGDPKILESVRSKFYMDDYLNSFPTEEEASSQARTLKKTLTCGNFKLTKWMSNSQRVVDCCINQPDHSSIQEPQPKIDFGPNKGNVLGMEWNTEDDALSFSHKNQNSEVFPFTRRSLLSKLSGFLDPLGLASPFTVKGKIAMQTLIKLEKNWDEDIGEDERLWWTKWVKGLSQIQQISISRCLRPGLAKETQLHVFCDASIEAFAAVAYLRHEFETGKVEIRIVLAKIRVAPVKPISVAKLELNAAVLGCRIAEVAEKSLRGQIHRRTFWTDSSAVRGWLRGTATFYQTFVCNRIGEIQTLSAASEWRHVPGSKNPADHATRSAMAEETPLSEEWINGPEFLLKNESEWPRDIEVKKNLDQIKSSFNTFLIANTDKDEWYSSLKTLQEALDKLNPNQDKSYGMMELIREAQSKSFGEERRSMIEKKPLKGSSKLVGLSPFMDKDDIIRVGGRIDRAKKLASMLTEAVWSALLSWFTLVGSTCKLSLIMGSSFMSTPLPSAGGPAGHEPSSLYHPANNWVAEAGVKALKGLLAKTGGRDGAASRAMVLEWSCTLHVNSYSPTDAFHTPKVRSRLPTPRQDHSLDREGFEAARSRYHKDMAHRAHGRPLKPLQLGQMVHMQYDVTETSWSFGS
ncbi:uncharacterized protein LOC131880808 [Tigriopus californicus]|uniref:uncharacterized protein LOC131880808 n=1 Tax=Tigriopus californicus TaxID=6832 RepID=UPI0027DA3DF4|nr:uncharacterized protein LOC131880808 [Tigriopus californicus]